MDQRAVIQRCLDYIEQNVETQISSEELAQQAGYSIYHFYRLFQSATGLPVKQYILRRRLLHGLYAIHNGSTGIDAALTYGFDTYAGFYKAVQREFGCTPAEFLRSCRAKQPYRIELDKEEHKIMTRKNAAEILRYWNLEKEPVTDIYYEGTGKRNENAYYVGDRYVLKFSANLGKLKNHISLSHALEAAGLCAAVPIAAGNGQDYVREGELFFCLTKRLPGKQLTAQSLYEGDSAGKAFFVGEIIGRLHLALERTEQCVDDVDLFAAVKDWALPKLYNDLGLYRNFCREYLETFCSLYAALPRQVIHRDPNPGNIICTGETWGFIDFELSQRNVRIYDPCYAASAVLSESFGKDERKWMEICHNILRGYDSVIRLTAEEKQAVPYVILANQLVCTAWFADQSKYAELFKVNQKMTLWIIEHFEELQIT